MAPPAKLTEASPPRRLPAGSQALLMLGLLVAGGLMARHVGRHFLLDLHPDPAGAAWLVGAGGLACAVGVPRQIIAFAGGYLFGAWRGGALSMLGMMLGCAMDFYGARHAARDLITRRLGARLRRLDRFLADNPFTATLTLRLLPVGNNVVLNLLGGISLLPARPFFAATMLGYVPQTAIFALLGSGVQLERGVQLGVGAGLFVVSAGVGWLMLKGRKKGLLF